MFCAMLWSINFYILLIFEPDGTEWFPFAFNDFATGEESQQSSWIGGQVDTKTMNGY